MTVSIFPSPPAGGIKSVQRGLAGSSGNVTITAVDIAKSFVTVFGTASSGTVAGSGTIAAAAFNTNSAVRTLSSTGISGDYTGPANIAATNIASGTTNLVTAVVQGFLANSTTLTVSGACRYEVVEFL